MKHDIPDSLRMAIRSKRDQLQTVSMELTAVMSELRALLGKKTKVGIHDPLYQRYVSLRDRRDQLGVQTAQVKEELKALIEPLQREEAAHAYALQRPNSGDVLRLRRPSIKSSVAGHALTPEQRDDT